jgi:hypothetical protein
VIDRDVERARCRLSAATHTDRPGGCREAFQLVTKAADVLASDHARRRYASDMAASERAAADRALALRGAGGGARARGGGGSGCGRTRGKLTPQSACADCRGVPAVARARGAGGGGCGVLSAGARARIVCAAAAKRAGTLQARGGAGAHRDQLLRGVDLTSACYRMGVQWVSGKRCRVTEHFNSWSADGCRFLRHTTIRLACNTIQGLGGCRLQR